MREAVVKDKQRTNPPSEENTKPRNPCKYRGFGALPLSCIDKKDALNPNASVSEIFQSPEYRHNHLFIAYLIQNYSNNPLSIAEANARKRLTARLPSVSA